jgi:hypothetical protein
MGGHAEKKEENIIGCLMVFSSFFLRDAFESIQRRFPFLSEILWLNW